FPIAEWTFDTDDQAATGAPFWAASGNMIHSNGIDRALVVTARGAQLYQPSMPKEKLVAELPVTVDMASRSFVVRVPTAILPVDGTWRVRLAAGRADYPKGRPQFGQEGVINATFRTITQEPPGNNYWDDNGQAAAGNDVTAFSQTIDWQALARHQTTPEPEPRGWSDRWYVSSIEP